MKTLRAFALCMLAVAFTACASTSHERTGTIKLPPVEYVK